MKKRIQLNRDQKHPLSRIPPEKKKELNYMLHDKEVISVFTDCSATPGGPNLGLGICFIGYNDIKVISQKLITDLPTASMYGELKAITIAIQFLPKILEKYRHLIIKPKKVIIYSDCEHVRKIDELLLSSNVYMREAMEEVVMSINTFNQKNPFCLMEDIKYLGENKKHHLYHRMAHSAAKKIL